jgi:hypothetical protein
MATDTTSPNTDAPPDQGKHLGDREKASRKGTDKGFAGVKTEKELKEGRTPSKLTPRERVLAFVVLVLWLNLFAGGMLVDTQPYRCAISWSGVAKIDGRTVDQHPCSVFWVAKEVGMDRTFDNNYGVPTPSPSPPATPTAANAESPAAAQGALAAAAARATTGGQTAAPAADATTAQADSKKEPRVVGEPTQQLVWPWIVTILFYTPLNLAFISAAAGALGTLGSIANLNEDQEDDEKPGEKTFTPRDRTNPLLSGLLRGVFVYLFVISGMLLFDDSPSDTGPNQYVRLAGFLSLFSFFVNYKPSVFSSMLDGAHKLISARGKAAAADDPAQKRDNERLQAVESKLKEIPEQIAALAKQISEQIAAQGAVASVTSDGVNLIMGQQNRNGDLTKAPDAEDLAAKDKGDEPGGASG